MIDYKYDAEAGRWTGRVGRFEIRARLTDPHDFDEDDQVWVWAVCLDQSQIMGGFAATSAGALGEAITGLRALISPLASLVAA
jgi:hypothetical protein